MGVVTMVATYPYKSTTGKQSSFSLVWLLNRYVMYSPGVEPMKLLLAVRVIILCTTDDELLGDAGLTLPRRVATNL